MRFYSLPENKTYPFLLVNRKNYKELFRRKFDHAIVDSGVMEFIRKEIKEYPESFLDTLNRKVSEIQQKCPSDKVWFVIPDYPDDYHPGQFGDNVEKTLRNIKRFLNNDAYWLPVIQSRYQNRFSFLESAHATHDLIGDYPQVAIGTVCKCRKKEFITYCCQVTRKLFPHSWIHAFGLTLSALPTVKNLIDSFDSLAWTYPRKPGSHSCKNKKERIAYWEAYLIRVSEICILEETEKVRV